MPACARPLAAAQRCTFPCALHPAHATTPPCPPPPARQAVAKDVPEAELERAKAAAVSSVLMNLESRAVVAEDIGRQVLTYGHRKPVAEFVSEIQALKPADMAAAVAKLLKSAPSLAVIGDVASAPRYDLVAKRFG